MNERPGYGDAEAKKIIERAITAVIIAAVVVVFTLLRQAGP